jgi:hypothetical protein
MLKSKKNFLSFPFTFSSSSLCSESSFYKRIIYGKKKKEKTFRSPSDSSPFIFTPEFFLRLFFFPNCGVFNIRCLY